VGMKKKIELDFGKKKNWIDLLSFLH